MSRFYKTVIQVEIISEGPIVNNLPPDKPLSYIEFEGIYGRFSNSVSVKSSKPIDEYQLQDECRKHGTEITFFTGG